MGQSSNPSVKIIPGHTITGSETWQGGSAYLVQGRIDIATGATLKIESGATIMLNGGTGWSGPGFRVSGTMIATGFKLTWADVGSEWGGIVFYGAETNKSQLKNCIIEHASGTNIHSAQAYYTGVIVMQDASPIISGCTIRNSSAKSGIFSYSTNPLKPAAPIIQNSSISGFHEYGGIMIDNDWFFNLNT